MTNFEKLKNMTPEQIAAEFMIFRPSDACFDDENRNYYALDGSWHQYSQDCFQANVKWLNEEIPKDPQDYIKELEAEYQQGFQDGYASAWREIQNVIKHAVIEASIQVSARKED